MNTRYAARGVSSRKEGVHAAVKALNDPGLSPSTFCKIVPDIAGDPKWCSVNHLDGADSKAVLAYLVYKETPWFGWDEHDRMSLWEGIAQDSIVMNCDDVAFFGETCGLLFL